MTGGGDENDEREMSWIRYNGWFWSYGTIMPNRGPGGRRRTLGDKPFRCLDDKRVQSHIFRMILEFEGLEVALPVVTISCL